jgi:hypothetical protein
MIIGFVTFGRSANDVGYQLLSWGSFATFFVTLFTLYHREARRPDSRSSSEHSASPGPRR